MPNGKRGNGNNGPRGMGGRRRGRNAKLQKAIDEVVTRMQSSPHIRFMLPEKQMRAAIDNELFKREVARRMKKIPNWKKAFMGEVQRVREMNYDSVVARREELDLLVKPFYTRLSQARAMMFRLARESRQMYPTFVKAARRYLVYAFNIAQIEQHRTASELVETILKRQRVDPQLFHAFEKVARDHALDEAEARRKMRSDISLRKWCLKEFERLKNL